MIWIKRNIIRHFISVLILISSDFFFIFFSIFLATCFRKTLNFKFDLPEIAIYPYVTFSSIYITLMLILLYLGIYSRRYDFWHESKLIVMASFLSFLIIFTGLAVGKNVEQYSRSSIFFIFIFTSIIIPLSKLFLKPYLYKKGLWKKEATIISDNNEFKHEIFDNAYLGYVKSQKHRYQTIFIDGASLSQKQLNHIIESNIGNSREIVFTPVLGGYDFTYSKISSVFNTRTSIFTLENRLLNPFNQFVKYLIDYVLIITLSFLWVPFLLIIMLFIKISSPREKVFFKQRRLGINGKEFICYKFRTMVSDQSFMDRWLLENPSEEKYYFQYHKYINDPRVTKLGKWLRKTSLDELPQIINVIKGDMSLVGPRPYLSGEKEFLGQYSSLVLNIKPGITGLWQVSGRSNIDFNDRIRIDVWYVKNWSLWTDIVILFKTINVVFKRDGAY